MVPPDKGQTGPERQDSVAAESSNAGAGQTAELQSQFIHSLPSCYLGQAAPPWSAFDAYQNKG